MKALLKIQRGKSNALDTVDECIMRSSNGDCETRNYT